MQPESTSLLSCQSGSMEPQPRFNSTSIWFWLGDCSDFSLAYLYDIIIFSPMRSHHLQHLQGKQSSADYSKPASTLIPGRASWPLVSCPTSGIWSPWAAPAPREQSENHPGHASTCVEGAGLPLPQLVKVLLPLCSQLCGSCGPTVFLPEENTPH